MHLYCRKNAPDTERLLLSLFYQSVGLIITSSYVLPSIPPGLSSDICQCPPPPNKHLDIPHCTTDFLSGNSPVFAEIKISPLLLGAQEDFDNDGNLKFI